jgi:hypothetical protein
MAGGFVSTEKKRKHVAGINREAKMMTRAHQN